MSKPRLPPLGTQDFISLTPNEQNIIRAMYKWQKATDTLIALPDIASPDASDLPTAIVLLNEMKDLLQQMIDAFQELQV